MKKFLTIVVLLFLPAAGVPGSFLTAQDAGDTLQKARDALHRGAYKEARALYQPYLDSLVGDEKEKAAGYFETFLARGEYAAGLEEAERYLEKSPENPVFLNARGKFLAATGKYHDAETAFRSARSQKYDYWKNAEDLAGVLLLMGKKSEARSLYNQIFKQCQRGAFRTADLVSIGAAAAAAVEEFHAANQAFRTAYELEPENIGNLYRWASLFREKFNNADAQRTFEEAIDLNPHSADLFTGYARSLESFTAMEELAEKALDENPNHVEALNILAGLSILDSQYDHAETLLKRALDVNPSSLVSLAHLASVYHFREQIPEYEAVEQRAIAVNPYCGDFYNTLAVNCAMRFRYRDAVAFGYKAAARERDNYRAISTLGTNLLRIGSVAEARRYLEYAFNLDAFDLFAKNSLDLIDEYDYFDVLESEHFNLKIHESESGVLGQAVLRLAEEAYDSLSSRYPYTPAGKILVEAYNDHADFAVRISGVPNLDLLGVCFGDIVAFDTPRAQSENEYNWARTLWHELAHVMALGISDHRVPRWFTEGLSVYEEKRARPQWARNMDIELFTAFEYDKLLTLDEIDKGFTRPEFPGQIMLSYYESSKIIEFIANEYGFDAVTSLLACFGARKNLETGFREVLDKSPADINREFFRSLNQGKEMLRDVLAGTENIFSGQAQKKSILEQLFGGSASPYFQAVNEGNELLLEEKYEDAKRKFLKALELYPFYVGGGNPYQGLAALYRAQGEQLKLVHILERFLSVSAFGAAEARELGTYFAERGGIEKAEYYYTRSFQVEPYDITARMRLAELYKAHSVFNREAEQRSIIVDLQPLDRAKALYNLALSLYNNKQIPEAKAEVLKSLEIAPGYRDAQKLLLKCVSYQK